MPKHVERPNYGLSASELHCILFVVIDSPLAVSSLSTPSAPFLSIKGKCIQLNADQTHRLMEAFGWKSPNVARAMFSRAMSHLRANASALTTPVAKKNGHDKDDAKPVGTKGDDKEESDEDSEGDESESDVESADAM